MITEDCKAWPEIRSARTANLSTVHTQRQEAREGVGVSVCRLKRTDAMSVISQCYSAMNQKHCERQRRRQLHDVRV
jgi:hypothetical protein